jgi:hypothetical protein
MAKKRILFLSYYFPPFDSVGVKRIAYWFNNIKEYGFEPVVFTAVKQNEKKENIVYVEAEDSSNLMSYLIKDKGIGWIKPLQNKLKEYKSDEFDYILISGGPFMQMLLTKFIKKNFNAKIILDFRDPFYANPRFPKNKIKDGIKLYFQNKFLKYTDIVITVNKECKNLINHNNIHLIDNGFDDTILENAITNNNTKSDNNNTAVATGKVYSDFSINEFFEALKTDSSIKFEYIGNNKFESYSDYYSHGGVLPYPNALDFINKADFCILFTGGHPFESSTKIFDYLGLNKTILVITEGKPKTGSLHEITKEYPNIFWSKNNKEDILNSFESIKKHKNIKVDTSKYARANGLKVLTQILAK